MAVQVALPIGTVPPADPDFPALLGAAAWLRLHPDIRRRFAPCHPAVTYAGRMSLERSGIGLLFALASKLLGGPLPWREAVAARAEVRVHADAAGGVVWHRLLWLVAGPPVAVRSTKRRGADGRLLECVDGGLGMELDVLEQAGALVFRSRCYFLALAGLRIPIPALLTPGCCTVTHTVTGAREFRFDLEMVHPLFGRTFRQTGLFDDPEVPS